jgi:hypothetical protein
VSEPRFCRRDLYDRPIGITKIDGVKIPTIVRSRDVHPEIRETSFPFQKAVPCRNMEGKMVVRSSSPTPFRIADPRTWTPADVARGSTKPASGIM